jgi:decaprenylphospho-beta-D-erythro-pentofuranosid-2-ulose 2-reductase
MNNILIVGATSSIAMACARLWVEDGARFLLVGRNQEKLQHCAQDLSARGAVSADIYLLDVDRVDQHAAMLDDARQRLGRIDITLLANGTLPDQAQCEQDPLIALDAFASNASYSISLLTGLANLLQEQRSGSLAVIGSVAGDRGRASNYLYGSAKAALGTFCSGLRARLHKSGVNLLTIKPGFVDTPMTQGLSLPGALVASPERVAQDIVRAVGKRRANLYTPWFWQPIMLIIKAIPEPLFKRLSL